MSLELLVRNYRDEVFRLPLVLGYRTPRGPTVFITRAENPPDLFGHWEMEGEEVAYTGAAHRDLVEVLESTSGGEWILWRRRRYQRLDAPSLRSLVIGRSYRNSGNLGPINRQLRQQGLKMILASDGNYYRVPLNAPEPRAEMPREPASGFSFGLPTFEWEDFLTGEGGG